MISKEDSAKILVEKDIGDMDEIELSSNAEISASDSVKPNETSQVVS
jgi:hypothetical protein